MKRHSQNGVALVITLIMLAVVTFMAVAFLAVSRSQKSSVTVVQDQSDARLMVDSAMARAQAQVLGSMLAFTNAHTLDLIVSTNLQNPLGYDSAPGNTSRTNVAYHYPNGTALIAGDMQRMLTRLQFDPRPPVFLRTNGGTGLDFRYYMDFNRNGRFETNGLLSVRDANNQPVRVAGTTQPAYDYFVGDPEWIGVLQRPDFPHSPSNRFLGRYAYVVLPAGRTLDLNFVHNHVKGTAANQDGYMRNSGVGGWELNLAGLLCDLNTNLWFNDPRNAFAGDDYQYVTNSTIRPSTGRAFDDALQLLNFRYSNNVSTLPTLQNVFGPQGALMLGRDGLDQASDGPLALNTALQNFDNDQPGRSWAGGDNPLRLTDLQEVFNGIVSPGIAFRLTNNFIRTSQDSYNRYSYYRLLSVAGVDSSSRIPDKIHLNYDNLTTSATNLRAWNPVTFFTNTAQRLLRASVFTNRQGLATNYSIGLMRVRPAFGIGDIMVYPTNEYTAEVHRMFQMAANIYDASTNSPYPSVFRPRFRVNGNAVYIADYAEVTNSAFLDTVIWRDVKLAADRAALRADDNVYGVPWVIGAKKGIPNFNEFMLQTLVQATRKLQIFKRNVNAAPTGANLLTNQMNIFSISNLFGIEAWNAYSTNYPRELQIQARVQADMALVSTNTGIAVWPLNGVPMRTTVGVITNLAANTWFGGQLRVPLYTNTIFLPQSVLLFNPQRFLPIAGPSPYDGSVGFPVPELDLRVTNRVQFVLIDRTARRVVDFVNIDNMVTGFNLTTNLMGAGNAPLQGFLAGTQSTLNDRSFWDSNRVGNALAPTVGISNQVYVSMTPGALSESDWRSISGDPRAGQDVQKAIEGFRRFLGLVMGSNGRLDYDVAQARDVPFTPTRRFFQETKWQANDPLVHYHPTDLASPDLTLLGFIKPAQRVPTNSNLGLLNERYAPWGGSTNKSPQALLDYNIAIKDPMVFRPDDWNFPTNRFPNIGWLGRVHRGTPWQTVYLKSAVENPRNWMRWSGSPGTHPTNDWHLLDVFTVALNENASRGLLAVNQTNIAAWSAVLSGVPLLTNSLANGDVRSGVVPQYRSILAEPSSPQLHTIVRSLIETRRAQANGVFRTMGSVLATPALSVQSPYLNTNALQMRFAVQDEVVERIPQQILSLLKIDEPRIVVYAFGQSLKPAQNSLVVAPGAFFQLCTNYQITGESAAKAIIRFDGPPESPRAIIESYTALTPE